MEARFEDTHAGRLAGAVVCPGLGSIGGPRAWAHTQVNLASGGDESGVGTGCHAREKGGPQSFQAFS